MNRKNICNYIARNFQTFQIMQDWWRTSEMLGRKKFSLSASLSGDSDGDVDDNADRYKTSKLLLPPTYSNTHTHKWVPFSNRYHLQHIMWTFHFINRAPLSGAFQGCCWWCFWDVLLHLWLDLQNMRWIRSLVRQSNRNIVCKKIVLIKVLVGVD